MACYGDSFISLLYIYIYLYAGVCMQFSLVNFNIKIDSLYYLNIFECFSMYNAI
jgi:hypothetical protein